MRVYTSRSEKNQGSIHLDLERIKIGKNQEKKKESESIHRFLEINKASSFFFFSFYIFEFERKLKENGTYEMSYIQYSMTVSHALGQCKGDLKIERHSTAVVVSATTASFER